MTPRLVFEPRGNVFFLITFNTPGHERLFKFFEQRLVARNQPRLDERGFRLHVGVGDLDAILDAPHRVADLQAGVPQRIQHTVNQFGQMRQRFARRDLAVVQKHEVNVAVRIQFRAAVTADGDERERRKLLLRLRRQTVSRRVPKMPQQRVKDRRARLADFAPAHAGTMLQFEPVRLDLEKAFVACELFRRVAVRR